MEAYKATLRTTTSLTRMGTSQDIALTTKPEASAASSGVKDEVVTHADVTVRGVKGPRGNVKDFSVVQEDHVKPRPPLLHTHSLVTDRTDRADRRSMGLREGLARKRLCGDIRPPSESQLKALEVSPSVCLFVCL